MSCLVRMRCLVEFGGLPQCSAAQYINPFGEYISVVCLFVCTSLCVVCLRSVAILVGSGGQGQVAAERRAIIEQIRDVCMSENRVVPIMVQRIDSMADVSPHLTTPHHPLTPQHPFIRSSGRVS